MRSTTGTSEVAGSARSNQVTITVTWNAMNQSALQVLIDYYDLDRAHARIRAEAHQGWIDDVEMGAVTPHPADDASARRIPPG